MEFTKTFVSKFNEGENVVVCATHGNGLDYHTLGIVIRIAFESQLNIFKYLVEFEDGSRVWSSEYSTMSETEYRRREEEKRWREE